MGVAYIFNKSCWGKGYATEAAQASVNYAFGALGAEEVIAEIRPENKKIPPRGGKAWHGNTRQFCKNLQRQRNAAPYLRT